MIIAVMKSAYRNLKKLLFPASIRNCLNCVHNSDDHSLLDFKSAVQYMKHFIYQFTLISVQPFVKTMPLKIDLHSQRTDFCSYFSYNRVCKSVSGPIFGLCSEHLSVVLRSIGFIRFQTRRNATTSTIAEANIVITRSFFVRSRQRSTTYRLKRSGSMWSEQCGITGKRICLQCSAILFQ